MRRSKKPWLITCWIFCAIFAPNLVWGASTIFLVPDQETYTTIQEFDVVVKLKTDGQSVKKVEGGISFDNAVLVIESISTENTAIDTWLVEPTFVNNKGKISFVGEMQDKSGEDLNLFTISFVSRQAGSTQISVSFGQVLSSENTAGNIAGALGSAVINIQNPLTYGLEPANYINSNTVASPTDDEERIKSISVEVLYRLLLIIIAIAAISLHWLVNREYGKNQ